MKRFTASIFVFSFVLVIGHMASPVYAASADLSLSPITQTINVGQETEVTVDLDTGGANTSNTDLNLTYDPIKLILVDIVPGTIYDQYIGKEINNSTGKASISGLASSTSKLFTGTGTFAKLTFKGIEAGTTTVVIDFTKGDKNDSNVVEFETNEDILSTVTNASLTIVGLSASPSPTPTPTPTLTNDPSNLPETASTLPMYLITIASIFFIGFGVLSFKYF